MATKKRAAKKTGRTQGSKKSARRKQARHREDAPEAPEQDLVPKRSPRSSSTKPRAAGLSKSADGKDIYFKGFCLNSFQRAAVTAIQNGRSVLVSAPTGAGKTLVAEYAIHEALRQGKRCIYTAPIKALSNQKYRDFQQDPDIEVGLMTGDVTIDPHAPLLIMTTEIFRNTIFEDPERVQDVEFLIFDEIHYLDDRDRGTVWEESLIFAPENIRMICLSATIQNLDSFGDWIGSVRKQEIEVIRHDKRPVPLHHMLYHGQYGGFPLKRLSQIQKKFRDEQRRWNQGGGQDSESYGDYRKRHPGRRARYGQGQRGRNGRPRVHPHLAARKLIDELTKEGLTPILYFCFSRRECQIKAERNSHRRLLQPKERRRVARHFDKICDLFQLDWREDPELGYLRDRALLGIGYHHAGMLPIHKEIVERLFTSGLLKLLFTTETFALGINMPARTACFDSLRKFDGIDFDYMKTRDYLQMAGRAGRQGIDDEGLVYSILDNEDLMEAPLRRIHEGEPEAIKSRFNLSYSTIINLYEHMGRRLVDAYKKSFSYWQLGGSGKKRQKLEREETSKIVRRISLLEEAGYLDQKEGLLGRAKIARQINGYEIQLTELLFQGVLDELEAPELAAIFTSLVFEERRGVQCLVRPDRRDQELIQRVEDAVRRFTSLEIRSGFDNPIKKPDWGLYTAAYAWAQGCEFEDFGHYTTCPPGDIVRTLRMSIQMLRQLQHALSKDYPLHHELEVARIAINRDMVDAKKQLELG
ncbi:MAG: hypothetical protein CSA62_06325 [Planctomycetota bacterium]|nr:MAG: hypothetical protein CSA62_06325 [Planctomycetota bacterium]